MRYGRTVQPGFLPVYSVDTEEEAKKLLTFACSTNLDNEYIASELVQEQTLDNLEAFGKRLKHYHQLMKDRNPYAL